MSEQTDIIIVGAGTAGLTAAIYGVRAGKTVLVLESTAYGGQIINTPHIDNYPGLPGISGYEYATALYKQATGLGAVVKTETVNSIEETRGENDRLLFSVSTPKNTYEARSVILATGAKNRPLGLEHEKDWIGSGISYCATCDGMFFKGKTVAVAGGGNTALEDALFLSGYCEKVYLIHRRNELRGEIKLQEELRQKDNVEFVLNVLIDSIESDGEPDNLGNERLGAVNVTDKESGEKRRIEISGLFIAIGQMPDNKAFSSLVDLDDPGYIIAGEDCHTSHPGIFAAGDCRTKTVRQLTTAAADGAIAALAAAEFVR